MRKFELVPEELAAFLRRFDGAERFIPAFLALAKRYDEVDRNVILANFEALIEPYMSNPQGRYSNKHNIIAAMTGVSRTTAEAWFTKSRGLKIPLIHLSKIADRLGVPLDYFLREDGSYIDKAEQTRITMELWKIENELKKENDAMRECYGYELSGIKSGKHKLVVYKTLEAAERDATELSKNLADDETLILFSAPADEEGKLASNQFKILDAWGKN